MRAVMLRDISGEEFESWECAAENDWRAIAPYPAGIRALAQLPCSYCRGVGRMISLGDFLYPDGYKKDTARREQCPLCEGPMECIAITST